MSEFETILIIFIVPILLAITYFAGRCDIFSVMVYDAKKTLAELKAKDEEQIG